MDGVGTPPVVVELGVCGEKADGGAAAAAAAAVRAAVDDVDVDVDVEAVASCGRAMACVVSCPGGCALRSAGSRAPRSMAPIDLCCSGSGCGEGADFADLGGAGG